MATLSAAPARPETRLAEATEIHTQLIRLALGVEESRSYWENVNPAVPQADRPLLAFEQRWFSGKGLD